MNKFDMKYIIYFKVGGKTGNKVSLVTSGLNLVRINSCDSDPISEPSDKSTYTQYVTTSDNKFTVPAYIGGLTNGTKSYAIIGTNATNLTIAKVGSDWIVTPTSTSTDDVTYEFKVNATDECNIYDTMKESLYIQVGCPPYA